MKINDIQLTENFKLNEFECSCCKTAKIKPPLLKRLQLLREGWGKPIVITGGYRCEAHNKAVGEVPRSRHRTGGAVDIKMPATLQETFCNLALRCGFVIAVSYRDRHFVHLEI